MLVVPPGVVPEDGETRAGETPDRFLVLESGKLAEGLRGL